MGDSPFFGYFTKRGYWNARKPTQSANIYSFIQRLNLQNCTITQVMAKIWHNARPWKVGTLIWLTLNRGLLVGTWLECIGIFPTCKVCTKQAPESLQHCLLECPFAKRAWEAFYHIWQKWGAPNDVTFSRWIFVMLGEAVFEREDDPWGPRVLCRRLFLHQITAWHPLQLYPLLPLVGEMPKTFRWLVFLQENPSTSLGGYRWGWDGHLEGH